MSTCAGMLLIGTGYLLRSVVGGGCW